MVRSHQALAALALLALSTTARAQPRHPRHPPAPPEAPTTPQTPTPPSPPAEPTAVELETARARFREGVECFQHQDWNCATLRFADAFRLHPSPLVRFNLALAEHNHGQYVESIREFTSFLSETTDTPEWRDRREAAQREIVELRRRTAHLTVRIVGDEARSFKLDGQELRDAILNGPIEVNPGVHHIEVEGVGGGRDLTDGTLTEGERFSVEIRLPQAAAVQSARVEAGWQAHTHTFGRQGITRAGPGGRFIDWSQQEAPTVSAVWERFPVTFAAQLSAGSMTGVVGLSARYFPQPWFGLELAGGAFSPQSTSGVTALAHLRIPLAAPSRWAFGVFFGMLGSDMPVHLRCTVTDNCSDQPADRTEHALAAWVNLGASVEWRFSTHLSLRALVGLQRLVNPATIRDVGTPSDRASYTCAEGSHASVSACEVYSAQSNTSLTQPFIAIDLGYSI